ncbi:SspB family protein [Thalassococcus lentus]|uniref:ClpXP protease specificity-enhancing factor SspB n=1 Tax=Thalassococcus lentus TaxID=1210524 RepID=A0ABT4XR09_9RHOB|nr:ClpXP protease specificity-enhancing factor SspB [Thalassococcus lentus]MDA7424384.1 ClpXP protease specificity-enhancing factor SspB [Thalassococcus lentus]
MSGSIDYGKLMHNAMRGLIQNVLEDVRDNGLPGDHHFFITFDTSHPDAELADWLSDRYPEEMTVVMQHWYDGLDVTDEGFAVSLNFGDAPERLYIPYDAIRTFVDPSVEFGLRFESQDEDDEDGDPKPPSGPTDGPGGGAPKPDSDPEPQQQDAEVVSLDRFRK